MRWVCGGTHPSIRRFWRTRIHVAVHLLNLSIVHPHVRAVDSAFGQVAVRCHRSHLSGGKKRNGIGGSPHDFDYR